MTCSDLAAMTKSFEESQNTANKVYNEFFLQGDEEKKLGLNYSSELMDRSNISEIPRMQIDFYHFCVLPAYEILYLFLGEPVKPWLDAIKYNITCWKAIKDSGEPYYFESQKLEL